MTRIITRFAPSPTGYLHLGHAASAYHVWRSAEAIEAEVILRIEDIDTTRCKPEFEVAILEDLSWLGLAWSGKTRRQSDHFDAYSEAIKTLNSRGLLYRCFRTRAEIAATLPAPDAPFFGHALTPTEEAERLDSGEPFAWRLSLERARETLAEDFNHLHYCDFDGRAVAVDPAPFGDVILKRKDIPASYHLACCHDDALQGVTHITRGKDLEDVTAIHVLLQALMGWQTPRYHFHDLVLDTDGEKLAKRRGSKSLRDLRNEGVTPQDIRAMTGFA